MANFGGAHDVFFINGDSQTLTLVSAGGATTSTTVFGTQTRAVNVVALAAIAVDMTPTPAISPSGRR